MFILFITVKAAFKTIFDNILIIFAIPAHVELCQGIVFHVAGIVETFHWPNHGQPVHVNRVEYVRTFSTIPCRGMVATSLANFTA